MLFFFPILFVFKLQKSAWSTAAHLLFPHRLISHWNCKSISSFENWDAILRESLTRPERSNRRDLWVAHCSSQQGVTRKPPPADVTEHDLVAELMVNQGTRLSAMQSSKGDSQLSVEGLELWLCLSLSLVGLKPLFSPVEEPYCTSLSGFKLSVIATYYINQNYFVVG